MNCFPEQEKGGGVVESDVGWEMVQWMKVITIKSENLILHPGSPQGGKREQTPGSCLWIPLHVPGQCMYAHVYA